MLTRPSRMGLETVNVMVNGETTMQVEKMAQLALDIARKHSGEWDAYLNEIQKTASEEEFSEYRKRVAEVMAVIYFEFIGPISQQFPRLKPEWLKPEYWGDDTSQGADGINRR